MGSISKRYFHDIKKKRTRCLLANNGAYAAGPPLTQAPTNVGLQAVLETEATFQSGNTW